MWLLTLAAVLIGAVPSMAQPPVADAACTRTCNRGDASSGPDGIKADAGADRGPSGGGPDLSVIHGPDHDPCTYRSLSAHDLLAWRISYSWQGNGDAPEPPADAYYGDDPEVRWAIAHCPANSDRDVLVWWPIGARPPASLIDALRERARDAVPFPVLAQRAAPSGERQAPFITQLPTLLWADPAAWRAVQAEAAIPGIVTVTAIGTPRRLVWDPGDGEAPVTCDGPGTPYELGDPDPAQPDCALTYHHSSALAPAGGPYQMTMSVEWEVAWDCSPGCGGGPLAPVTVTTRRPVWVAELQALTTAPGG
jgi:hypothetical protein